jgi:AcrR family transcriptional regulator
MARRPRPEKTALPPPTKSKRERIIEAFMALLAEKRIEEIGFGEIAARAGVSLADCREEFNSVLGVFAAHTREVDRQVIAAGAGNGDMAEESPRERLFDLLMRRLELLSPHRPAVRSLMRSACGNPGLALALDCIAVRSQQWMLTAADIDAFGTRGMIRAQGLALIYARTLRVWLDDDDPGLARTLAELDRNLARAQSWAYWLDDICRYVPRWPKWPRWPGSRRSHRHDDDLGDEPATA